MRNIFKNKIGGSEVVRKFTLNIFFIVFCKKIKTIFTHLNTHPSYFAM